MKKKNGEYVREAGGWAWILADTKDNKILEYKKGNFLQTTNNYCELYAIHDVLKTLLKNNTSNSEIYIYSDSAYCVNMLKSDGWIYSWAKANWKRKGGKDIENLSLIQHLYMEKKNLEQLLNTINFIKVQGHSNNIFNNMADKLAVEAKKDAAMGKI
jgi:ribonuclease HI